MKKRFIKWIIILLCSFILIFYLFNVFTLYEYNQSMNQIINAIELEESIYSRLNSSKLDKVEVFEGEDLETKINENYGKYIYVNNGSYEIEMIEITQSVYIYIDYDVNIKLKDEAEMPLKGGAVFKILGTQNNYIEDVIIILNGTIDGNNEVHNYENSGNEGINIQYSFNCAIVGNGTIKNVSGDGIDIDASENTFIQGIKVVNSSGSGVHFGSPRPITGSKDNYVLGVESNNNGQLSSRFGFDQSWPNSGVIFNNVSSKNNFENFSLQGKNSFVMNSYSIYDDNLKDSNLLMNTILSDEYSKNIYIQNLNSSFNKTKEKSTLIFTCSIKIDNVDQIDFYLNNVLIKRFDNILTKFNVLKLSFHYKTRNIENLFSINTSDSNSGIMDLSCIINEIYQRNFDDFELEINIIWDDIKNRLYKFFRGEKN